MYNNVEYHNVSPNLAANPISRFFFWWLRPLLSYGLEHDLQIRDLHNVKPIDSSEALGDNLEEKWNQEINEAKEESRDPSLLNAMAKVFLAKLIYFGAWLLLCVLLRILQPHLLGVFLNSFVAGSEITKEQAIMYASILLLTIFLNATIEQHVDVCHIEMGMRMRIATSSLIYRKVLKLSQNSVHTITSGEIINLLSNDVRRFNRLCLFVHYIWLMPIQFAIIFYLIWSSIRIATLAGMVVMLFQAVIIQGYLGRIISKLRSKTGKLTGKRVQLMNEVITGMQVIKMYAWERPFEKLVSTARKYEVDALTRTSYVRAANSSMESYTDRLTLFFTVVSYVLLGNVLSADKIFSIAQYFSQLSFTMTAMYPLAIFSASEAFATIKRLEKFLVLEEHVPSLHHLSITESTAIKIENVTATWNINSDLEKKNTLCNINIVVESGKLYAVIGRVGAGKSSLLQLILGELPVITGKVSVGGSISYASQEPWLFSGNVRDNILFGQPYDKNRYDKVVQVCELIKDFEQLPQGDKTVVGDRGSHLSGGQKARVNLARAVYRKADIYIFDDPLSAVDTHVSKNLFEQCIREYLHDKTRILVTHQVQYLKNVDFIVMLKDGVIERQGSFRDFQQGDIQWLKTNEERDSKNITDERLDLEIPHPDVAKENEEVEEARETDELIARGRLSRKLFWQYFRTGGSCCSFTILLVSYVIGLAGSLAADNFLAACIDREDYQVKLRAEKNLTLNESHGNYSRSHNDFDVINGNDSLENSTFLEENMDFFDNYTAIEIYGGLMAIFVLAISVWIVTLFKIYMNTSRNLHNITFQSLVRAPMQFFNNNPLGRIINRFSKDMGCIDEDIPPFFTDAAQSFTLLFRAVIQILIFNWWSVPPIAILSFIYWKLKNIYLATAQDLKRLESTSKSPVFSHMHATFMGLITIRSAETQKILRKEFDEQQDINTSAHSLLINTAGAFGVWSDFCAVIFIALLTYSLIFLKDESTFAGNIGLVLSQSMVLVSNVQFAIRRMTDLMTYMTSVERVIEYTKLKQEGPFESSPGSKPPQDWPAEGCITFEHVYLKYSEDGLLILNDLNFVIEPGMKVGVVGRTGAGKTSLISALFRLAEFDGSIRIDRIDIKKIGLHDLRNKLSVIPQEPMLFSSTLRDNLDPCHHFQDNELWNALEEVGLKTQCQTLDQEVNQGGLNFSIGQRQLLCLARAILRKCKILILDEATANVDLTTDEFIQKTIRQKFKECTVLTIAHRLNTVMDSDRIIVMENGQIMEFDAPYKLLEKEDGYLTKMCNETGASMAERLKYIAQQESGRLRA